MEQSDVRPELLSAAERQHSAIRSGGLACVRVAPPPVGKGGAPAKGAPEGDRAPRGGKDAGGRGKPSKAPAGGEPRAGSASQLVASGTLDASWTRAGLVR
mgnify:CR=1 FL=1